MKLKTIFEGIAVIGGGILAAWIIKKSFDKQMKRIDEQEEKLEEEKERQGITEDLVPGQPVINSGSGDFVIDLLTAIRTDPDWELDRIDLDNALTRGAHIVHVRQSIKDLDIFLELPAFSGGNYNAPQIGDFINSLKEATEHMWSSYVKFSEKPFGVLEAYFVVSYEYKDDPKHERHFMLGKVPRNIISQYRRKDKETGKLMKEKDNWVLTRCVADFRKELNENGNVIPMVNTSSEIDGKVNVKIEDIMLLWRISFRIQTSFGVSATGINIRSAEQCLSYLINEFEIEGKNGNNFQYDQLMFYKNIEPDVECWEVENIPEGGFRIKSSLIEY